MHNGPYLPMCLWEVIQGTIQTLLFMTYVEKILFPASLLLTFVSFGGYL